MEYGNRLKEVTAYAEELRHKKGCEPEKDISEKQKKSTTKSKPKSRDTDMSIKRKKSALHTSYPEEAAGTLVEEGTSSTSASWKKKTTDTNRPKVISNEKVQKDLAPFYRTSKFK